MLNIKCFASGSSGNLYLIDDGRAQILLECGRPFVEIQKHLDFKTSELAACLITHEHLDHAKAVKEMLKRGVHCYMSRGTAEALGVENESATWCYVKI